jgi:hypothetical protein
VIINVLEEVGAKGGEVPGGAEAGVATALHQALLLEPPLQALAAAAEGFVDRRRR